MLANRGPGRASPRPTQVGVEEPVLRNAVEDLGDATAALDELEAELVLAEADAAYPHRLERDETTGRCVITSIGEDAIEGTEDDLEFRP